LIQGALQDLFDDVPGHCNVAIVKVSMYVPAGIPLKFGVVRASVLQAVGERSYCIGYIPASTGVVELIPAHDKDVVLAPSDRLVLLRRMMMGLEGDENEVG
jgi:hypothetical protein